MEPFEKVFLAQTLKILEQPTSVHPYINRTKRDLIAGTLCAQEYAISLLTRKKAPMKNVFMVLKERLFDFKDMKKALERRVLHIFKTFERLSPNTKVCDMLRTMSVHKREEGIMLVPPGSRFSYEILADSCELYISRSKDVELVEISSVCEFCKKFVSLLEDPNMQYH
jgi:hypothetical protein